MKIIIDVNQDINWKFDVDMTIEQLQKEVEEKKFIKLNDKLVNTNNIVAIYIEEEK